MMLTAPFICPRCWGVISTVELARAALIGQPFTHGCGEQLKRDSRPESTLLEHHRRWLATSAVPDLATQLRSSRSILEARDLARIGHARRWLPEKLPLIAQPWWDVELNIASWEIATGTGEPLGFDRKGKPLKYLIPRGASRTLDLHPAKNAEIRTSNDPVYIAEGLKKADSLFGEGQLAIAVGGVYNWMRDGKPLPEWDAIEFRGRLAPIVFDSDLTTNADVQRAAVELRAHLIDRGAEVPILLIDKEFWIDRYPELEALKKLGIDDLRYAGGSVKDLPALEAYFVEAYAGAHEWFGKHSPTLFRASVGRLIIDQMRSNGGPVVTGATRYLSGLLGQKSNMMIQDAVKWLASDSVPFIEVDKAEMRDGRPITRFRLLKSKVPS